MHILEIPSFFPPHGGLFCLEQAKALKAYGHEVRVVSIVELGLTSDLLLWLRAPWGEEHLEMEGVEVMRTYMRARPKAVRRNIERWVKLCEEAADRYVRRYGRPDVLHAHCCKNAGLAARRISRRLGIPYFITEHLSSGLFERDFGKGWTQHAWLKSEMRDAYDNARCVVPVSRELVDDLAPFFGRNYRWEEVSNVVDTAFWRPAFSPAPPSPEGEGQGGGSQSRVGKVWKAAVLAVADIRGKGYDVLADALQALWEHGNGEVSMELHIAGRGTDGQSMRRLFAPFPFVRLHGELDRQSVRQLLWQCDALILPSRSEAQPLSVLEALACGLPIVATDCLPQSVRIPGACRLVPVGDARALAEAIRESMSVAPSQAFSEAVSRLASPAVVASHLSDIFQRATSS